MAGFKCKFHFYSFPGNFPAGVLYLSLFTKQGIFTDT
jgi:hypothetical protein